MNYCLEKEVLQDNSRQSSKWHREAFQNTSRPPKHCWERFRKPHDLQNGIGKLFRIPHDLQNTVGSGSASLTTFKMASGSFSGYLTTSKSLSGAVPQASRPSKWYQEAFQDTSRPPNPCRERFRKPHDLQKGVGKLLNDRICFSYKML